MKSNTCEQKAHLHHIQVLGLLNQVRAALLDRRAKDDRFLDRHSLQESEVFLANEVEELDQVLFASRQKEIAAGQGDYRFEHTRNILCFSILPCGSEGKEAKTHA